LLRRISTDSGADARRFWKYATCVGVLFAAWIGLGEWRLAYWRTQIEQAAALRLGVCQVDTVRVGCEAKLRDRSLKMEDRVDLVCWPESSIGSYSCELCDFTDPQTTTRMSRNSRDAVRPSQGIRCDVLAGGKIYRPGAPDEGPYSMTAFLISPSENILGRYVKRTLVPFGEYMPGEKYFPVLREWAGMHEFIDTGSDASPLVTSRGNRIGVVICYEDMIRTNVRATVAGGAEILFSLINGGAFEQGLTLEQHKRLAQMRAVEHRRFFVRCASTGVTCVISPLGQVIEEIPAGIEGAIECPVKLLQAQTVYTRYGEYFPWMCTLILFIGLIRPRLKNRRAVGR
jgi:apolipoprotein N-acyltransferase